MMWKSSRDRLADYFEEAVGLFPEPKTVSNWIMSGLRELNAANVSAAASRFKRPTAELLSLIKDEVISGKIGKEIFPEVFQKGVSPKRLIQEKGLVHGATCHCSVAAIDNIIARFPKEVGEYGAGKEKLLGFFVGQVMKETRQANPARTGS